MTPRAQDGILTSAQVGALAGPTRRARATGMIAWRPTPSKTNINGQLRVLTDVEGCEGAVLHARLLIRRPWEFHFSYVVNSVALRRVDVNEKHGSWPIATHEHRYDPMTKQTVDQLLPNFPGPQIGESPVSIGVIRSGFFHFSEMCNIELPADAWSDPEGWR